MKDIMTPCVYDKALFYLYNAQRQYTGLPAKKFLVQIIFYPACIYLVDDNNETPGQCVK